MFSCILFSLTVRISACTDIFSYQSVCLCAWILPSWYYLSSHRLLRLWFISFLCLHISFVAFPCYIFLFLMLLMSQVLRILLTAPLVGKQNCSLNQVTPVKLLKLSKDTDMSTQRETKEGKQSISDCTRSVLEDLFHPTHVFTRRCIVGAVQCPTAGTSSFFWSPEPKIEWIQILGRTWHVLSLELL